jgi:hypothetical protein
MTAPLAQPHPERARMYLRPHPEETGCAQRRRSSRRMAACTAGIRGHPSRRPAALRSAGLLRMRAARRVGKGALRAVPTIAQSWWARHRPAHSRGPLALADPTTTTAESIRVAMMAPLAQPHPEEHRGSDASRRMAPDDGRASCHPSKRPASLRSAELLRVCESISDLILRSAYRRRFCAADMRVSKDGRASVRCGHPSRRTRRRRVLLRMRSEIDSHALRMRSESLNRLVFMESIHLMDRLP